MEERARKLQRVNAARYSIPHASQSAFASMCALARKGELPAISTSKSVREARDSLAIQTTDYGKLIVPLDLITAKGEPLKVEVVNPLAYLSLASRSIHFGKLFEETYSRTCLYTSKPKGGSVENTCSLALLPLCALFG
eukprot:7538200-Pyramimonas_sp.AAC.1